MGLLIILLSVCCYGISNCLWVIPLRKMNFLELIILRSFLSALLFAVCIGFEYLMSVPDGLGKNLFAFELNDYLVAIGISIFCYFGLFFYVLSLKEEKVSVAVPVSSINAFFGVLFSVTVLGEVLSKIYLLAALFFMAGVVLLSSGALKSQQFILSKGVFFNLAAAFFWGVGFAAFAIPVNVLGVLVFSLILELTVCLFSIFLFWYISGKLSFPIKKIDSMVVVLAGLGFGGLMLYNLSLAYIPVSLASLMGILTPMVSLIFSALFLKERLSLPQYIGAAIILIGLLILKW